MNNLLTQAYACFISVRNGAILLDESHKLDLQPLDEFLRPKKWQIQAKNLHGTILEGKSIRSDQKRRAQMESTWFEDPRCKARVELKDSIRFKWVQIGS